MTRALLAALAVLCALALSGCAGPGWERSEVILRQERAEIPSPTLGETPVGQRFVAPANGLSLIEVLLIVPQGAPELPSRPIAWELQDAGGRVVKAGRVETAGLAHNTPLRLAVGPLSASEGAGYTILLRAPSESGIALWASRDDTLRDGWLVHGSEPQGNDLWLRLTATATPRTALLEFPALVEHWKAQGLWLLALLFAPGALLLLLLHPHEPGAPPDAFGPPILALGLSLAGAPLLYLWLAPIGLRLTDDLLRALLEAAVLGVALLAVRHWHRTVAWLHAVRMAWPAVLVFLLLLLAATMSRLLAVRDVVLPPWVDGVHHTMIVEMFQQQNMLPGTYRPFLPIDRFTYHFGFHALAAVLAEASHQPAPATVLFWGQVINVAVLPGLFLLARRLARSTWAGLWALSVPLLALMPAYFTTWGRYTQLLGLALLPIALVAALDWLQAPRQRPRRVHLGQLAVAALLGAGLVVIHYRVLVYYAVFLGLYLALTWVTRPCDEAAPRLQTGRLTLLALLVVGLSAPWLWQLWREVVAPLADAGAFASPESYNGVPTRFLTIDITRWLFGIAAIGLLFGLLVQRRTALLLALWVGVMSLIANPAPLGLRPLWLINNESLVISYWLPTALATGLGLGLLVDGSLRRLERGLRAVSATLLAGLLLVAGFYGAWWRAEIINDTTILATADDVQAAEWIKTNLPRTAKFLINSRFWQGEVYVGSDGGYWLPVLTGRQTTLPPAHYIYANAATREQINDLAATVSGLENLDAPALRARLRALDVTHVYLGARGGSLKLDRLRAQPALREVYQMGDVHIFELLPEG